MKRALVVTAYDRPHLLASTLESLSRVRGLDRWDIHISIDPCGSAEVETEVVMAAINGLSDYETVIHMHEEHLGVLRHPWVIFETLFVEGYDYVLRLEDDMLFTEDLLEFHEWASNVFWNGGIGFVESRSSGDEVNVGGPEEVMISETFGSPLAIGTWPHVWRAILAPTWDHDYSTNNGTPGVEAGWDWNLKRVYPRHGLMGLRPVRDKVFHTGVMGVHSTPEIYEHRPALESVPEPLRYRVLAEEC